MSDGGARLESVAPRPVNLGAIERELARLWEEPDGSDATSHLSRACMSNLVILCDRNDEANAIARNLSMIVQQHPSRVLLLVARVDDQSEEIDAFVSAQCYLGSGGRQICSEQVTVRTHADAAHRLPSIVRALVIGDLPTAVWWGAGSTPAFNPLFDELADGADQIIYDSAAWAGSLATLAPVLTRAAALEDIAVADLAWQRLQPWLHFISCVLDPDDLPGAIDAITEVVIEHGAGALSEAVLLASWFASRLGWQLEQTGTGAAADTTWTLRAARARPTIVARRGDSEESLSRVTIRSVIDGAPVQFTFTAHGQGRFEVGAEGIALGVKFHRAPAPDGAALVALELSELGRDPLFHETLGVATRLAMR